MRSTWWAIIGVVAAGILFADRVAQAGKRLWRTAVAVSRGLVLISEIAPVLHTLVAIGREFENDGGNSLRDRVDAAGSDAQAARRIGEENKQTLADQNADLAQLKLSLSHKPDKPSLN